MFEYIHNIQGTLRLRAGILKANGALARELQIELGRIPGVRSQRGSARLPRPRSALSMRNPVYGDFARKAARSAASYVVESLLMALL